MVQLGWPQVYGLLDNNTSRQLGHHEKIAEKVVASAFTEENKKGSTLVAAG